MEVTGITSRATSMVQSKRNQEVSMAVFKKALDAEASAAMALVRALPSPVNLPTNLGQNINTTA